MTDGRQSMIAFIVDEIRRARVVVGMTQEVFGRGVNYSNTHVSAVETGSRPLTRDYVRGADKVLKTGGLFERMVIKFKLDAEPSWLREWIETESKAESLRWFENAVLPGLLQTEPYARAVYASMGVLTADEVTERVAARMDRQAVLTREKPPQITCVLDEGLLHRPVGGPEVMRAQLRHLVQVAADLPHVRMQVVPTSVGAYGGLTGPFIIATLPGGENVAFLDNYLRGQLVYDGTDVMWIAKVWESIRSEALPHHQSTKLISEVAERWI